MSVRFALGALLVAHLVSCSGGREESDDDVAGDAGADASGEDAGGPGEDAGRDAAPDGGEEDAGPDGGHDAGSDGGGPDAGCEFDARCVSRLVERCDPEDGAITQTPCAGDERCVDGACEALPPEYGTPCRTEEQVLACEAARLECGGMAAVILCIRPGAPIAEGGECWGLHDCTPGLICNRGGYCSAGNVGDDCWVDEDCAGASTCEDGTCAA